MIPNYLEIITHKYSEFGKMFACIQGIPFGKTYEFVKILTQFPFPQIIGKPFPFKTKINY